ncbi:MAG: hypothetical protein OXI74_07265 [Rhodospirillaceae bacterium]|nr:hypothetical protein [Rhodospirillaceae bacterium]
MARLFSGTDLGPVLLSASSNLSPSTSDQRSRTIAPLWYPVTKGGPFGIPGDLAWEWLCPAANPDGWPNSDVLKPWFNGMDLTRRPAGKWIVDFGWKMTEEEAALYEVPFGHVRDHVHLAAEEPAKSVSFVSLQPKPEAYRLKTAKPTLLIT